jgi:CheY-like chemotaxis protein
VIEQGLRVLIVEDEALVAMLIEEMLAELGHHVVAISGRLAHALGIAADAPIDLAILDVNLSGEPSFPVADLLGRRGIPMIFATGYGAAGIGEYPEIPVLQKPFESADLGRAIMSARKRSADRQERSG